MITWTAPVAGGPRDAVAINTIFTAISNESAALPAADWRLEGLDRRALAKANSPFRAFDNLVIAGPSAVFANTAFAIPSIAGTPFQSAAFSVPSDGQVIIDAGMEFPTVGGNEGVEQGYFVEGRFVIYDGTTTTSFPFTTRRFGYDDGSAIGFGSGVQGHMRLRLHLDGATYAGSYTYAAVQTRIASRVFGAPTNGYYLRRAQMVGVTYPRGT